MSIEIELKFMVTAATAGQLSDALSQWSCQPQPEQKLANTYYETADNFLRSHGMGLRIRRRDQRYEMTLKTEGSVIAGLHQRPEYNVLLDNVPLDNVALDNVALDHTVLSQDALALERLPAEVWPQGCDVAELAASLNPLFTTNFVRQSWVVTYNNSRIELALDLGEIKAGEHSQPLAEVELELLEGTTADLLLFAQELAKIGGLRMGSLSKAARGYHLAQGRGPKHSKPLGILSQPRKMTVEQGMIAAIEQAMAHWQYHEELWLAGDLTAKAQIANSLAAIRQVWLNVGGMVPRKATTALRACFEQIEALIESAEMADDVIWHSDMLQTKLALTQWLVERQWLPFCDKKSQDKLAGSYKRFADIMLSRCASELKESFNATLNEQDYRDRAPRLLRQLLSIHQLGGAYSGEARDSYIANWQALLDGINAPQMVYKDALRKQALATPVFWLSSSQHPPLLNR